MKLLTYKAEIVFVRILLPFTIGILIAHKLQLKVNILFFLSGMLFLFSGLVITNIYYKSLKAYNFKSLVGALLFLSWFTFGALICLLNSQLIKPNHYAKHSYPILKGWIKNEPQVSRQILRFEVSITSGYLNLTSNKATGTLLVALSIDSLKPISLTYGDELIISCHYSPLEPPYNPAEFDFSAWLATKNIYHQTFIKQNQLFKLNHNQGNPIVQYAIEVRKRQVDLYRKLIKDDEAFAVASTLVLGYRADLSKETLAAYSKTGTIHALSVSGMHVGIIYIFLNWALSFLDKNKLLKIIKVLLICSLIWYYSLLTGFSPSVLRSAVMLTVYILAKTFNKNSNSYNILAFTAFCLLCYDPFLLWDVGFQLSFLAVFGLIYLQPKIHQWIVIQNKWLDQLWATTALSLAAQITTFPLSIYYFHQFPLYFIISNLFILLPLSAMMYLGIGILTLRLYFLAPLFEWIIRLTNEGLKWIADLPFAGITAIWINQWQLIILTVALGIFVFALANYQKKLLLVAMLFLLIFQLFATDQKLEHFHQRKIIFFSLRKNYATAFIDGDSAVLLTDLSDRASSYQFFVKPALDQLELKKIKFIAWETDTTLNAFIKKDHQIAFHQYQILLLDQSFNHQKIEELPKFDLVWLHQNPKKSMVELRQEVIFSNLLIDVTNQDGLIAKFEREANKLGLKYYTLKKNKAYLIQIHQKHD